MDELYSVGEHIDLATLAAKCETDIAYQIELLLLCVKGLRVAMAAQDRRIHDLEEELYLARSGRRMRG